jgi:hypothetical protein
MYPLNRRVYWPFCWTLTPLHMMALQQHEQLERAQSCEVAPRNLDKLHSPLTTGQRNRLLAPLGCHAPSLFPRAGRQ